jgi:hypothetical protein
MLLLIQYFFYYNVSQKLILKIKSIVNQYLGRLIYTTICSSIYGLFSKPWSDQTWIGNINNSGDTNLEIVEMFVGIKFYIFY